MLSTFLFDLDGTLVDSKRDIAGALCRALGIVAPDRGPPRPEQVFPLIGKPFTDTVEALGYRMAPEQMDRMEREYRAWYSGHCMDTTTVFQGVPEMLEQIRDRGPTAIVTTKPVDQAVILLEKTGLLPYFDHVQGWVEGATPKPAPDLVYRALAKLAAAPCGALMVGDTEADVGAGRAAGVKTCVALYGFRTPAELRALGPDYEIAYPLELPKLLANGAGRE